MNADTRDRLLRTLFQGAGFYLIGHAGITQLGWENASGLLIALISTYFTYRASESTADLLARLGRTALQGAGAFVIGRAGIDFATWEAISGAVLTLGTTAFTVRAAWKKAGVASTVHASPVVTLLAIGLMALMMAGCSKDIMSNPNFAPTVGQVVEGTSAAAKQANAAIDKICANYELVDAAFQLIALAAGDRIPQPYRDAETDAVRYLADLCARRPTNAQEALESAQKAYATIIVVRDHFKKK